MLHQILAMLINTQPDFTDPLNLTISIYILHNDPHKFPKVLTKRIFLTIKHLLVDDQFPSLMCDVEVIM